MAQPLPTYLRSQRRKWALTQRELAELLGNMSAAAVSKYETLARTPSLKVMLAFELLFGEPASELFPAIAQRVRRAVLRNAAALRDRLAANRDARSVRKCRLLDEAITRLQQLHERTS
jgi:transcriptional regulator with XRE-family HTH domain